MAESQSLTALRRLGQKVVEERDRIQTELRNEVEVLQEAGMSALMLALILSERGAESDELAELDLAAILNDPDPQPLIWNGNCIGTCKMPTIEVEFRIMCKNSFMMQ
jgi:hypothetical protein